MFLHTDNSSYTHIDTVYTGHNIAIAVGVVVVVVVVVAVVVVVVVIVVIVVLNMCAVENSYFC